MGNIYCSSENYEIDNIYENFIAQILLKLKIRNLKIPEIKKLFDTYLIRELIEDNNKEILREIFFLQKKII
jgi:hypothetical protein